MTSQTPEQLEAEIAQQREDLAATVSELHARLDVKSKAKDKVAEVRSNPAALAGVGLAVVLVVGLVVWRRRRSQ